MTRYQRLMQRIERLPVSVNELGLCEELEALDECDAWGVSDEELLDHLEDQVEQIERGLVVRPFLEPRCSLEQGRTEIGKTLDGEPVRISIGQGAQAVQHICLAGSVGSGKTRTAAAIAVEAANDADVVLIDSHNAFASLPLVANRFEFVPLRECRLNPFDPITGLHPFQQDQTLLRGLAETYSMQLSEIEAYECVQELREGRECDFYTLLERLKAKKYQGFSNRARYRDTAVLYLSHLLDAVHPLFDCRAGMDLLSILTRGAVVLQIDAPPAHTAYLIRYLFDFVCLLHQAGTGLDKRLLLMIDEAQLLMERGEIADQLLKLRHSYLHLCMNVQHPHLVSPKALGNVDCLLVGALQHERDRRTIQQQANLTPDQSDYLPGLEPRQCVCSLPRSEFKRPFIIEIPFVESDDTRKVESAAFLKSLDWTPRGEAAPAERDKEKYDSQTTAFLRDVLNQAHEFSALTQRFERAGVRSASKQGQIIKRLCSDGLIRVHSLPVGRGRPVKLVEATSRALEMFSVTWRKTRGGLLARAATEWMERKIVKLGWTCVREGTLTSSGKFAGEKQVDLLCRGTKGELATVEIAGCADHECHNAIFCARCDEVTKHVVVCVNKKVLAEVKRRFSEIEELRGDPRIEVVVLSKALSEGWKL